MTYLKAVISAVLAMALVAGGFGVYWATHYGTNDYPMQQGYAYAAGENMDSKNMNPEFALQTMTDTSMVVIGSSELTNLVPSSHPARNFSAQGYDADFCLLGATGTQCLWAAMELGALADRMPTKKVAFIVSEQWFSSGGVYNTVFQKRYSAKTMQMLLDSESVSQETKDGILARAQTLLAGSAWEDQVQNETVFDDLNSYLNRIPDILRLDKHTVDSTPTLASLGITTSQIPEGQTSYGAAAPTSRRIEDIDWDAWLAAARAEGEAACTNNDMGIYNAFWEQRCASVTEGSDAKVNWGESVEYDDLRLFMDVCRDTGIEPLIIIQPVKGEWADYTGISKEVRTTFYNNIRSIASEYGAEVADFSGHEYDTYFLCDTMHLGWEGWTYVEQAVCDFYRKD